MNLLIYHNGTEAVNRRVDEIKRHIEFKHDMSVEEEVDSSTTKIEIFNSAGVPLAFLDVFDDLKKVDFLIAMFKDDD